MKITIGHLLGFPKPVEEVISEDEETRLLREISRGQQAKAVLDNVMFREVGEKIRNEVWDQFAGSTIGDDTARREARLKLWAFEQILNELVIDQETLELAEISLQELRDKQEKENEKGR